jgi:hypothetical protein
MATIKRYSDFTPGLFEGTNSDYLHSMEIVVKGDKEAAAMAKKEVGDGKEPNHFFVTKSNDYLYTLDNEVKWYSDDHKSAPIQVEDQIEVETFGPYNTLDDAMKTADKIDLTETTGPRYVMVEDRKTGQVYEKYLKAEMRLSWNEETNDERKRFGYPTK